MATNAKNLAELLNTDTTVAVGDIADGSVTTAKLAADANKDSKYLLAQSQTHRAGYAVDISTLSSIDDPLAHKTKGNIDALKTTYAPMSAVSTRRSGSSRGTVGRFHR